MRLPYMKLCASKELEPQWGLISTTKTVLCALLAERTSSFFLVSLQQPQTQTQNHFLAMGKRCRPPPLSASSTPSIHSCSRVFFSMSARTHNKDNNMICSMRITSAQAIESRTISLNTSNTLTGPLTSMTTWPQSQSPTADNTKSLFMDWWDILISANTQTSTHKLSPVNQPTIHLHLS